MQLFTHLLKKYDRISLNIIKRGGNTLKTDIIEKANDIIDITKNNQEKYNDERNLIFNLLKRSDDKEIIDILESVIKIFEKNKKSRI